MDLPFWDRRVPGPHPAAGTADAFLASDTRPAAVGCRGRTGIATLAVRTPGDERPARPPQPLRPARQGREWRKVDTSCVILPGARADGVVNRWVVPLPPTLSRIPYVSPPACA